MGFLRRVNTAVGILGLNGGHPTVSSAQCRVRLDGQFGIQTVVVVGMCVYVNSGSFHQIRHHTMCPCDFGDHEWPAVAPRDWPGRSARSGEDRGGRTRWAPSPRRMRLGGDPGPVLG